MRILIKALLVTVLVGYVAAKCMPNPNPNPNPKPNPKPKPPDVRTTRSQRTRSPNRQTTPRPRPPRPPSPSDDAGSFNCGGGVLTVEERRAILNKHNELRSQLATGKAVNRDNTVMPRGKNIYALTYNCTLENQAQQWINRCQFDHSPQHLRPNAGENLYYFAEVSIPEDRLKNAGVEATTSWWDELKEDYPNNPSNEVNNYVLGSGVVTHFIAMAWGKTTSIGCGKSVCRKPDFTYVYIDCQYHERGVWIGEKIYELGSPCQKDSDCTTFPRSKCLAAQGLCKRT